MCVLNHPIALLHFRSFLNMQLSLRDFLALSSLVVTFRRQCVCSGTSKEEFSFSILRKSDCGITEVSGKRFSFPHGLQHLSFQHSPLVPDKAPRDKRGSACSNELLIWWEEKVNVSPKRNPLGEQKGVRCSWLEL